MDVKNGAIFFPNPAQGPTSRKTLIAQLTLASGKPWTASAVVTGKTAGLRHWEW
mgnify:CR=1 FL=1